MSLQAILFDVYRTLLVVEPGRTDANEAWGDLCCDLFHGSPRLDWAGFNAACDSEIARLHIQARDAGIAYPEILWPRVVAEVLPEWRRLPLEEQREFLFRQAQLARTVRLNPGAAETLRWLNQRGVTLGILSNAQEYTLWELDQALAPNLRRSGVSAERRISICRTRGGWPGWQRSTETQLREYFRAPLAPNSLFAPWLCFWSFENGFSKPDPHCFRLMSQRLLLRNILPGETLMVGDRLDYDIEPAQRAGWQTWHLAKTESPESERRGDWARLRQWLSEPDRWLS
jgi:putative hydrolase of the HAD superfamily